MRTTKPNPKLIGSIHHPVNFPQDQEFFHASDIPDQVKEVVGNIKVSVDPDILEMRKKPWNTSVIVNRKEDNVFYNQGHNFVKPKPQIIYQGTETRDDPTGWNVSVEQTPHLERERLIEEETMMRMRKTKI